MLRESWAFLKKDILTEASYKLVFVSNVFGALMGLISYFFIDKLFGSRITDHLAEFGVNYFSYVLLSSAFFSYIGTGLSSLSHQIHNEQAQGTLEAILATPIKLSAILFSVSLWHLLFATIDMAIFILAGIFFFKINFGNVHIASALIILALSIISFSSLGILSASFVMVFKRGNPVAWVINNLEGLVSGVYFPITIMPGWLQGLAQFFPITYAIRGIELAVYRGYSPRQLAREILFLLGFSVLLLPLSLFAFYRSVDKAKRDGSLLQY